MKQINSAKDRGAYSLLLHCCECDPRKKEKARLSGLPFIKYSYKSQTWYFDKIMANISVLLYYQHCNVLKIDALCVSQLLQLKRQGFYKIVQSLCWADHFFFLTRKFLNQGVGRWEFYSSTLLPSLNWTLTTCFQELLHQIPCQSSRKPGWFDGARVPIVSLRFQDPNSRFLFGESEHILRFRDTFSTS